jgi:hypothetical protein
MVKQVAEQNFDDLASFTRSGAAGDVIFKQGDAAGDLCIVQDGRIELVREPAGVRVGMIEEGGVFGEWSFFEGQPRDVTARAATDVRLICLDRAAFDRVTSEAPEIAVWISQKLARTLHERLPSGTAAPAPPAAPAARPAPPAAAPPPPRGDARLVEEKSGTAFTLSGDEAQVGRLDRKTGYTPEVDLSALDVERTLSRRHARIIRRGQTYFVREDTSSRNGTFVNGQRIDAAADVELHDGDEVRFGLVKTIFRHR